VKWSFFKQIYQELKTQLERNKMSLHDISKNHGQRLNPKPNSNDEQKNPMAHGTTQNHNAGEEAEADGLKFKERQILAKQDGDNKAVFGFLESTNAFGLKVAKEGYDVLTAADENLVFNSEQNVFKIVATAATSITALAPVNSATVAVTHNLGFTPTIIAYVNNAGQYVPIPFTIWSASAASKGQAELALFINTVNSTQIVFQLDNYNALFTGTVYPIKYYVVQETAA
jgi:hypothetical protein